MDIFEPFDAVYFLVNTLTVVSMIMGVPVKTGRAIVLGVLSVVAIAANVALALLAPGVMSIFFLLLSISLAIGYFSMAHVVRLSAQQN